MKIKPLHLTFPADNLRELIAKHPDYPIVVLAGESANNGDFSMMYCHSVRVCVEEILTAKAPYNKEYVENDRDDFEEQMEAWLWDELDGNSMSESEFRARLSAAMAEYEPYWKKVIAIYADN